MKKIIICLIILILIIELILILYNNKKNLSLYEGNAKNSIITQYLKEDLWDEINCYDAGHTLLVPMFYAFQYQDKQKIEEYHNLFSRYSDYLVNINYAYNYWDLNHMQFNFLASNYINLCYKYNCIDKIKDELLDYLYDEAFFYCFSTREKYNTDIYPRYNALLATKRDFELGKPTADLYQYHFMIIFNLKEFSSNNGYKLSAQREDIVKESISLINYIYKNAVTFIDGDKWLLNVGCFDEHEDYAYMNYNSIEEDMKPSNSENTTWDTSHFARIPVFLQIIKRANKDDIDNFEYYNRLINGLREQFLENVLVEPDSENDYYRTKNYMDSRNGLYRYNYTTQVNNAYLPYQLSGTMLLGWWSFLGGELNDIYYKIYETFPLSDKAIKTYVGPNTTRERNKYVKWPDYFENGFAELVCFYASKLDISNLF